MFQRMIVAIFCLMCLLGCKTKYVSVPEYHYVDRVHTDTFIKHDSVFRHDSVIIRQQGDTIFMEKFKTLYRDRWRDRVVIDSVVITDSIRVPVPVERELTWWQKVKIDMGESVLALLLFLLLLTIFITKPWHRARDSC